MRNMYYVTLSKNNKAEVRSRDAGASIPVSDFENIKFIYICESKRQAVVLAEGLKEWLGRCKID